MSSSDKQKGQKTHLTAFAEIQQVIVRLFGDQSREATSWYELLDSKQWMNQNCIMCQECYLATIKYKHTPAFVQRIEQKSLFLTKETKSKYNKLAKDYEEEQQLIFQIGDYVTKNITDLPDPAILGDKQKSDDPPNLPGEKGNDNPQQQLSLQTEPIRLQETRISGSANWASKQIHDEKKDRLTMQSARGPNSGAAFTRTTSGAVIKSKAYGSRTHRPGTTGQTDFTDGGSLGDAEKTARTLFRVTTDDKLHSEQTKTLFETTQAQLSRGLARDRNLTQHQLPLSRPGTSYNVPSYRRAPSSAAKPAHPSIPLLSKQTLTSLTTRVSSSRNSVRSARSSRPQKLWEPKQSSAFEVTMGILQEMKQGVFVWN